MTAIRSESTIASSWSWVTKIEVMPSSRCSRLISVRVRMRSAASRLDSGSSIRKTAGLRTTARPTATRWRWPPLSSAGRRSQQRAEAEQLGGAVDLAVDRRAVDPLLLQAEAHVLAHRHVRIERVVLEDHGDVALVRLEVGHVAVVEDDGALRSDARARRCRRAPCSCRSPTGPSSVRNSPSAIVEIERVDGGHVAIDACSASAGSRSPRLLALALQGSGEHATHQVALERQA